MAMAKSKNHDWGTYGNKMEAPDPWEGTATARGWWVVLFSKWLPESMNWVAACTKDNIELTSNPGLGSEKIWSGPYM